MTLFPLLFALAAPTMFVPAPGGSGLLDQESPDGQALLAPDSERDVCQQQVRAGVAGRLEGVLVTFFASQGSAWVRVRLGPGWNTGPIAFETQVTISGSSVIEPVFIDTSSAGIHLGPGDTFVVELQATTPLQPLLALGNNVVLPPLEPLYPEPLFWNGSQATELFRLSFRTWMLADSFADSCFGDGSSGVSCPCDNQGVAYFGCNNSIDNGGARLWVSGTPAPDTLSLRASQELATATTIFVQGDGALTTAIAFGDGLRCAGGNLLRLFVKTASGGVAVAPGPGDPPLSVRSADLGDPVVVGQSRWYQAYYRDGSPAFCPSPTGGTFNTTNAIRVDW